MKIMNIFLIITLIFTISCSLSQFTTKKCDDYKPDFANPSDKQAYSLDFCRTTEMDENTRCCFIKWKDGQDRHQYNCYPVTRSEFLNIKDVKNSIKGKVNKLYSIDCGSSYLIAPMLLIFALLF